MERVGEKQRINGLLSIENNKYNLYNKFTTYTLRVSQSCFKVNNKEQRFARIIL